MSSSHSAGDRGLRGGLWSCPRVPAYSRDTQELLNVMMQESRLTNFQQRQIREKLNKGGALPLHCPPTSSEPPKAPPPKPQPITALGPDSRRRSAAQCQGGGGYERERFRPCATRDLEKEKRRLQNLLATGCEEPPPPPLPAPPAPPTERDRFQEVLDEIEERRSFLEEMTSLGRGKEYQPIISTEISQKIRELEMIDKVRSSKLTEEREREMARGRKDQQQQ